MRGNILRSLIYATLLASLLYAPVATAGPRIEFGEEGGFVQLDLKLQVYIENADIGSGPRRVQMDPPRSDWAAFGPGYHIHLNAGTEEQPPVHGPRALLVPRS